jgi:hypothetical protein
VPNYLKLDRMEMQYSELGRVAASRDRCGLPVPSFSNRKAFCNLLSFFLARHLPTYTWRASSSKNTLINPFACTLLAPCAKPAKIQPISQQIKKAAAKAAAAIACDQTSVASLDLFHRHRLTKHTFLYAST